MMNSGPRLPQLEKALAQKRRPNTAKNKLINLKKKKKKRICLPMQGTRVQALVREDPTCRGATKPVRHNHRACALEPTCHNY